MYEYLGSHEETTRAGHATESLEIVKASLSSWIIAFQKENIYYSSVLQISYGKLSGMF